jgi:hypothetical protein
MTFCPFFVINFFTHYYGLLLFTILERSSPWMKFDEKGQKAALKYHVFGGVEEAQS